MNIINDHLAFVTRVLEILHLDHFLDNRRPDLHPGGWWQTAGDDALALSWIADLTPTLLIRNTHNSQFGPLTEKPCANLYRLPLADALPHYRAGLTKNIANNRLSDNFRLIVSLTALLHQPPASPDHVRNRQTLQDQQASARRTPRRGRRPGHAEHFPKDFAATSTS